MLRSLLLCLIPLAQALPQSPASRDRVLPPDVLEPVRARIRFLVDSAKVPSLAVAVAKDGRIIWEEGFGYADVARKTPATATTLYSMASISKPIAATGVLKLAEQGKLDLDRPANDYLGRAKVTGLAGDAAGATVRRVLSHTAGLPLHYRFFYEGGTVTRPSMDEAISRYAIAVYPPGAVYNYSNLGYGVLEEIVAKVSGRSFEDFMRDEVFQPLGMPTTTIGTGAGLANSAVRYDAAGKPVPYYDFDHRAASAVYTSAHELVRFGMFHLKNHLRDQKPVLADSTIAMMQRVATPGDTLGGGYGLGWGIGYEFGMRVVSHTGGMPGVSTTLKLYPEHNVAIAVLANASTPIPHRAVYYVAGAVLPRYNVGQLDRPPQANAASVGFAAPGELWGEWTGTIRLYDGSTTPLALLIKPDDVHVRLGAGGALWTVLNGASYRANLLGGRFLGTIPSEEARRFPHSVSISLWLDGGKLRGWAAAITTDDPVTGAMSSYAELTKRVPARP